MTFADASRALHGAHKPWHRGLVRPRKPVVKPVDPMQRAYGLGLNAGRCDRQWWDVEFRTGAEYLEALRGWRRGQRQFVAELRQSEDEAVRLEGRRRARWLAGEA